MLSIFRKSAESKAIKGLMFLLLLTFILWGVGDIFRQGNRVIAFKVGDKEYTEMEWHHTFQQSLQRLSQQLGVPISKEQVRAQKLHFAVMDQIISSLLLEQETKDIGLLISDDMAKNELASLPVLQTNGKFDGDKFAQFLRASNQSEDEFIKNFKLDIAQNILAMALSLNRQVPEDLAVTIMAAQAQVHKADVLKISPLNITVNEQVKDSDLQEIYQSQLSQFSTPEKRDISYIKFGLDAVQVDENVSDKVLEEQYQSKKTLFSEPEKRKVAQMLFKDEKQAKEAFALLNEGKPFSEVAKKFFPKQTDFSLGEVTAIGFEKAISEAIFQTEVGKYSQVVKSPLGYHIFLIEKITPSKIKDFSQVKEVLKKQYLDDLKFDALSKLAQDIDTMSTSGDDLEAIAQKHGLKVMNVKGFDADQEKPKDTVEQTTVFKNLATTTEEGKVSMVTPLAKQDQFIVVSVAKIDKAQPLPFDTLKDKVKAIWVEKTKKTKAQELANQIYGKLSQGAKMADVAKEFGLTAESVSLSYLNKESSLYPENLVREILYSKSGQVINPLASDENYYVAQVTGVEKPQIVPLHSGDKIAAELQQQLPNEILMQYMSYLRKKFGVEVNEKVIESAVSEG
jgi:peptidyl-prolyl cis-trans isomerase D